MPAAIRTRRSDNRTILEVAGMMLVFAGIAIWLLWRHEHSRSESLRAIATSLGATLKPKVPAAEMAALLDRSRLGSHGRVCALTNSWRSRGPKNSASRSLSIIIVSVRNISTRNGNAEVGKLTGLLLSIPRSEFRVRFATV
jgi:hypothetical protein